MDLNFWGNFNLQVKKTVPTSLKALVSHCLYGSNIKEQVKDESQIALSIAEFLYFNTKKKDQKEVSTPSP